MDPTTESLLAASARALSSVSDIKKIVSDDPDGNYLLKRGATLADYEAACDEHDAQIIDGDLWIFAPASSGHQQAAGVLSALLDPARRQMDETGWVILPDINLRLSPGQLYSPDLTGWRRSRMPERPDVTYFDLTPDWVCEVLSRSTQRFDKGRKREEYAKAGVKHMWLVDADRKMIDVFDLASDGIYRFTASASADDKLVLSPFDFELDLSRLWAR